MKKLFIALLFIILLGASYLFVKSYFPAPPPQKKSAMISNNPKKNTTMSITSTAFTDQADIPTKYTCSGEGSNPPLNFSDVPQNAKSLVLIVDDPDAPMGTFVHWVIYNLSPKVTEIPEKVDEIGSQGLNGAGRNSYYAPCPPSGTHHYHFKLYALDTTLDFPQVPDKKAVEEKMQGHIIAQTELVGLYHK